MARKSVTSACAWPMTSVHMIGSASQQATSTNAFAKTESAERQVRGGNQNRLPDQGRDRERKQRKRSKRDREQRRIAVELAGIRVDLPGIQRKTRH